MWQQEDDNAGKQWEAAIAYCEGLSLALHGDRRMPDIKELRSIVDNSKHDPSIDASYFPNTNVTYYWSSTTNESLPDGKWIVLINDGVIGNLSKSSNLLVRCVRGGV